MDETLTMRSDDMARIEVLISRGNLSAAFTELIRSRGVLMDLVLKASAAPDVPEWLRDACFKAWQDAQIR